MCCLGRLHNLNSIHYFALYARSLGRQRFLSSLHYPTKQRFDVVIFMLMAMGCSDGLTFGMTLFVPETELNIDPPVGQTPRTLSGPPVLRSRLQAAHPKRDDVLLCAKRTFIFILLWISHSEDLTVELKEKAYIYHEVFCLMLNLCTKATYMRSHHGSLVI
jgi:hypothetical protein